MSFHQRQRRAETLVSQFQLAQHRARIVNIAEYSRQKGLNSNCSACQPVVWPGNSRQTDGDTRNDDVLGTVPVDTERSETRRVLLNDVEIAVITITSLLALILASVFLTFNILYRHER